MRCACVFVCAFHTGSPGSHTDGECSKSLTRLSESPHADRWPAPFVGRLLFCLQPQSNVLAGTPSIPRAPGSNALGITPFSLSFSLFLLGPKATDGQCVCVCLRVTKCVRMPFSHHLKTFNISRFVSGNLKPTSVTFLSIKTGFRTR